MNSENEIYRSNIERLSRPHIPISLRPVLDNEQKRFENCLRQGFKLENGIELKLVRDPNTSNFKERILIYDTASRVTSGESKIIGEVGLAGYSYITQYKVDLSVNLIPSYRGKGILEHAVEKYDKLLHNHGVIDINFSDDKFSKKQF